MVERCAGVCLGMSGRYVCQVGRFVRSAGVSGRRVRSAGGSDVLDGR